LYQGFVFPGNQSDSVKLKVEPIPASDPLFKEKTELLQKNQFLKPEIVVSKNNVKEELLVYYRILSLDATEIADEKVTLPIIYMLMNRLLQP
jgi:hypothetical protein